MSDAESKQRNGWVLWPDQIISIFWLCVIEDMYQSLHETYQYIVSDSRQNLT